MRVGVVGPGAMGSLLAVKMSRAGLPVTLLDHRPERAALIAKEGLVLETGQGELRAKVPVTLNPSDLSVADLVLICVKAYDTGAVARKLQCLASGPHFLTLQNGVGNVERLGEWLPPDKILAGITSQGATALGVGRVRHAGIGETCIGTGFGKGPAGDSPGLQMARDALSTAGFEVRLVSCIDSLIWSKLMVNVGINALTALTRLPNGALRDYPETEGLMNQAVCEAVAVAKAKGIALIFDDPRQAVGKVCHATARNISSMLQDVLRGKRTEIDFINGAVIREGERLGLPVPVNTVLTQLVRTLESSYAKRVQEVL